ncbi:MAG: RluA family pseudouridine synthase [Elusimicrobia bacterium]|nr:RluA family pseudouridine synthase [Candidatus Liberimonas magnetica]
MEKIIYSGTPIPATETKERIDLYLSTKYKEYSRGYFQKLISSGNIKVNGRNIVPSYRLKNSDEIEFDFVSETRKLLEEDIPLNIIHEDKDILVVNKTGGLVVHPACGHKSGTLLNALFGHAKGRYSPQLVHRLDKDTSGAIVVAKNEKAKNSLVKQFQHRDVKKKYLVIVRGKIVEDKGRINAPLGRALGDRKRIVVGPEARKKSVTEFKVLKRTKNYTMLEVYPVTGRTHQIRSHLVYIGHPVLGDEFYGGPKSIEGIELGRQMLHSCYLSFTHPKTSKKVEYNAPMPEDMDKVWKKLK